MAEPCFFVKPKGSLARDKLKGDIVQKIAKRITELPNFNLYKRDLEMLTFILSLVEHLVEKPKKDCKVKIDKKDIAISAIEEAFGPLDEDERNDLSKNIDFLIDNDQIKKFSKLEVAVASVSNWFHRKILN